MRSDAGATIVARWASGLPRGSAVIDLGCGSGVPISVALRDAGLEPFGIDASPTMAEAFRRNLPHAQVACEPVEQSRFFGRRFQGAVAIGLLFLLDTESQLAILAKVGAVLEPGGRFLFSAPREPCSWDDLQTGRRSKSLGADRYAASLERAGLRLVGSCLDEGGNHYFDALKAP